MRATLNQIRTRVGTTFGNLGQSVVTGVEVELSLPLAANATILSAAIQAAGSGTLAANDGSPGTGPDEAIVSWQVQYTGALDDQVDVPLALEGRSTTAFSMGPTDRRWTRHQPPANPVRNPWLPSARTRSR